MWRVTIKGLLAHKLRLALTALSIVLGVTFIAGTFVLTDTLNKTFDTLFSNVYQNIDFQVRGVAQFGNGGNAQRNNIPESLVATVQGVPGVAAASGTVTGYAQYVGTDGKAIANGGAPTLGLSFDPDQRISALRLVQGAPPTTPNDVVMDLGTAQKYGFKVGQRVRILSPGAHPDVHHHGHRAAGTADSLAGATLAAFDTPTAQRLFGRRGPVQRHQCRHTTWCGQGDRAACHCAGAATWRRGGDRADRRQRGRPVPSAACWDSSTPRS